MINAEFAKVTSQQVNRDNWLNAAGDALSDKIMEVAETGKRELEVPFYELIIGAENLEECAEMLEMFEGILANNGYEHRVSPNGILTITW